MRIGMIMLIRLLSILAGLLAAAAAAGPKAVPLSVFWQSSNPIFNSSLHENHFVVRIGTRLRIECPKSMSEASIIHRVDRTHADLCELPKDRQSTTVGDCRRPGDTILVTFRAYSPVPGGLEFHVDKEYFFITTSTGENTESGLLNPAGGLCSSRNMKLRFTVLRKSHPIPQHSFSGDNEHDGDATSIDNKSYNYVPEEDSKPIVGPVNPGLNHEREDERVPFNRVPLYPPFGVPYWTAPNRSPGTVAPLMSDSADRSDESENRFREGVDYKIEYRYDDVSGTSCLRPVIGLLLAFSIFLIFFNR